MQVDIVRKDLFDLEKRYRSPTIKKRFRNLWVRMMEAESSDYRRMIEMGYRAEIQGGRIFFKK